MNFFRHLEHTDLNGPWSFAFKLGPAPRDFVCPEDLKAAGLAIYPCKVPGNFELDLQANRIIEEPFRGMNIVDLFTYEKAQVWYFRDFESKAIPDHVAELVFEGVDCLADIYLNGLQIGSIDNMLVEQVFDVTAILKRHNTLFLHIKPAVEEARKFSYPPGVGAGAVNYESLYVRKAPHMYGWDILPRAISAGIWRPVYLRYQPRERLEEVYLRTLEISETFDTARLCMCYKTRTAGNPEDVYAIHLEGTCGDSNFTRSTVLNFEAGRFDFDLAHPKLWWPAGRGEASLYQIEIQLIKNGQAIDRMTCTHGIRTIELIRSSVTDEEGHGEFCFKINGERVFAKGSNWVPVDAYHSRDVFGIPATLELAHHAHCNILRCWGGNVYENDLFYERCDQMGIMVWQDFAMACAVYPQDPLFCDRLAAEARKVVKRLRQHACLILWAGDNECDQAYTWYHAGDPNRNVLTRTVLPRVLQEEDPDRPYLPSSPYVDPEAYKKGESFLPEAHLWGARGYYKAPYYQDTFCHFASEIGYHGCPSPESIRKFITPEKCWPYRDNEQWILHSTSPVPGANLYTNRVDLMANQIRELFGHVPDALDDFAFASQATQAEALKFFIEQFRLRKWRRTGIIWWNLRDGWPQFSDAVVDYYFKKKLAYHFIRRAQQPIHLILREPKDGFLELAASNDTRNDVEIEYLLEDVDREKRIMNGVAEAKADAVNPLSKIPLREDDKCFVRIEWRTSQGRGMSHYLAGKPPFDLEWYRKCLKKAFKDDSLIPERVR